MVGKIKGTGSYRPVQVWDNDKLSHMMDTSDEWIRGRTGIGQRHIAFKIKNYKVKKVQRSVLDIE